MLVNKAPHSNRAGKVVGRPTFIRQTGAMSKIPATGPNLASLFPDNVAYHYSTQMPANAKLLDTELQYTVRMAKKRLRDFTHGRYCARAALRQLGIPAANATIGVGAQREPVWPEGIIGSISHTDNIAVAVIARTSQLSSIGIDIESAQPLEEDLIKMIIRPDEMANSHPEEGKLIFSIKESIYKCIYPQLKLFVDFQDMEVIRSEQDSSFTAVPHNPAIDSKLVARLQGRYKIDNDYIISSAWIE